MSIEVKIGVIQHPHEVEIEMDTTPEELMDILKGAADSGDSLVWLTSKKKNQVGIPASKIAFVEIRTLEQDSKKMGFNS